MSYKTCPVCHKILPQYLGGPLGYVGEPYWCEGHPNQAVNNSALTQSLLDKIQAQELIIQELRHHLLQNETYINDLKEERDQISEALREKNAQIDDFIASYKKIWGTHEDTKT